MKKKRARRAATPTADSATDTRDATVSPQPATEAEPRADGLFSIVGIGASAGGLEAFTHLLETLPADTGMAFVFVQHLAPTHVSALPEILARATPMPVREVRDEPAVEPNHVYVIPPGQDMVIAGGRLQLQPRQDRGGHRPVDRFLRALAEDQGHRAIGVVLSGTGTDGTIGLDAIKAEGGITFAQDGTAQHEGMPHSAIASGCVDFVLPPDAIAHEIARIGQHPYAVPEAGAGSPIDQRSIAPLLRVLHRATGVDFSHYKFNTLYRRVTRRMVLQKLDDLQDYVRLLQQTPAEVEALYHDILISVTSFFRNPEAFDTLKEKVFPRLVKDRSRHDPVRIWSLGCSTGQEAYSLAMAFAEFAETNTVPLQVFATDLVERGVDTARVGVYSKDIAQDVSPERLRRFFVEVDAGYQITKAIRDVCVFSRHNVLADPPFSRIDLISCRNLLIYLEPVLQQQIMPILHYALKPCGFLWLGGSETIGSYRNLFEAEDVKHKIYAKKPGPHGAHFPLQQAAAPRTSFVPIAARSAGAGSDLHREADRLLLSKFAPPSVLVSADLDILQYRGDTGPYLAPAPGKASLNLLKMLREGLLVGVRGAIVRAGREQAPARVESLRVRSNGGDRDVTVEVVPLKSGVKAEEAGGFLVLFDEAADAHGSRAARVASAPRLPDAPASDHDGARLAQELSATREYLQSVIEQQEAANEELQSANEEVQSANEELQSINEELETSKEEIQSSNEELATVNDELNNRNVEMNRLNNDLVNLIGSVQMAIVIVGPDLRIRRFTPAAEKLLNLIPTDVGRPLVDIKLHLENLTDLAPLLTEVIDTVSVRERDVRDAHGHWYSLRLRPYRTLDHKIDGVVVLLVDVDTVKRAHEVSARLAAIVTTSEDAIISKDLDGVITSWNTGAEHLFGYSSHEAIGQPVTLLIPPDHVDEEPQILERVRRGEVIEHYETVRRRKDGRLLDVSLTVSPLTDVAGRIIGASKIARDISERKRVEGVLRESEQRFRSTIDQVTDYAIFSTDVQGRATTWNQGVQRILGFDEGDFIGHDIVGTIFTPEDVASGAAQQELDTAAAKGTAVNDRWMMRKSGERFYANGVTTALKNDSGELIGFTKVMRDRTEHKRTDSLIQRQRDSLELLVQGQPLEHVLDFLARSMESQSQGRFLVAIHLMEADGHHFGYVAAPSLPASYAEATRGMDARLELGTCSSAVMSQRPTVVRDFAAESRWPAFTAEVVSLGLRGCFTTPIVSPDQTVLGTFAIYYREPGDPNPHDQQMVELVTRTVAVAIERKQAEERLRQSQAQMAQQERLYEAILSNTPDLAYVFDLNHRFTYANQRLLKMWGRTWDEAIGKNCLELGYEPWHAEMHDREIEQVIATKQPIRGEVPFTGTFGRRIYDYIFVAVVNDEGEVEAIAGTTRDVTERKQSEDQLRESEERFRTLAENMSQFAWTADAKGMIYWYNQRWYDYTGTTPDEMQGDGWKKVHHPNHLGRVVKSIQKALDTGGLWEDTFPLRGKDGSYRWFLSRSQPIRDEQGKVLRWFGTNTDITEQRQMADELRQNAADMSETDRRKDEFLAMLAHELRGPLAPMRNALQIVRHAGNRDSSERDAIRSATDLMERQTGQMVRLVDELLDVSRVSRGKIALRRVPVELASMANHAVEASQPLFDSGGLTLTVTVPADPIYVNADAARMTQVIGNLLNNAAKFTPKGGGVWLTLERDEGHAVIRVRDSGIGIGPDDLSRVFELFMQVDTSLERTRSGLGLGLTLAKNLVELHDGTIDVYSGGLDHGTQFVVRLPALSEPPAFPPSPQPPDVEDAVATPRRVLVVDDNHDSAESLAILLELRGHEVRMAHDGLEAVDVATTFVPDVILLDIGLPKLNGYEAARRIRTLPSGDQMLLVAVTGWGQETDRSRSAEAGFDVHLVKPVDHDALSKLMADLPPR